MCGVCGFGGKSASGCRGPSERERHSILLGDIKPFVFFCCYGIWPNPIEGTPSNGPLRVLPGAPTAGRRRTYFTTATGCSAGLKFHSCLSGFLRSPNQRHNKLPSKAQEKNAQIIFQSRESSLSARALCAARRRREWRQFSKFMSVPARRVGG